jgi:hypothetical protein
LLIEPALKRMSLVAGTSGSSFALEIGDPAVADGDGGARRAGPGKDLDCRFIDVRAHTGGEFLREDRGGEDNCGEERFQC